MPYKDPQKRKEYIKEYRQKNKEAIKKNRQEYHQKNKERIKEVKQKYYLKNKEDINKKNSKNYYNNKDKWFSTRQKYSKERRDDHREILIERLGGKCSHPGCNETENLQFDHKDPKTKSFCISTYLGCSMETLIPEVDKCQLLCPKHHLEKSFMEEHWKELERNELGQFKGLT